MVTKLRWSPDYGHDKTTPPPHTRLTCETAEVAYNKLRGYLGLCLDIEAPAGGWDRTKKFEKIPHVRLGFFRERHLFYSNGFHHKVCWMPFLKEGWRRLQYDEFCRWYGIPI